DRHHRRRRGDRPERDPAPPRPAAARSVTTGPIKRDCSRCGRHGYPATHFPDGYLCGPCLRAALDIRGPCPGCGTTRPLPGRRPPAPPPPPQPPPARPRPATPPSSPSRPRASEATRAPARLSPPSPPPQPTPAISATPASLTPALRSLAEALAAAPNAAATAR